MLLPLMIYSTSIFNANGKGSGGREQNINFSTGFAVLKINKSLPMKEILQINNETCILRRKSIAILIEKKNSSILRLFSFQYLIGLNWSEKVLSETVH